MTHRSHRSPDGVEGAAADIVQQRVNATLLDGIVINLAVVLEWLHLGAKLMDAPRAGRILCVRRSASPRHR
jgi:hypothetical protein